MDRSAIELACDLAWRDFEDAVQVIASDRAGCQYLVTRNPGDYKGQKVTITQPAEFLALWATREAGE